MQAKDVMTTRLVTVSPDATVREIAKLLLERRISAVPVVGPDGKLKGIVSEGDLMRRPELGTLRHRSWWLSLLSDPEEGAMAYVKTHGGRAKDVMTSEVITVDETASLEQIADTLEKHGIKRVPVLKKGKLVGIVSRANLLRGLVARQSAPAPSIDDETIKTAVEAALVEAGVRHEFVSILVAGGVVNMWGAIDSEGERLAAHVAAESTPGVKRVCDKLNVLAPSLRTVMWAE